MGEMSWLTLCPSCGGFLPERARACPNCARAAVPRPALGAALAGGLSVTLMACYGITPEPPPPCSTDADCAAAGAAPHCNRDLGFCNQSAETVRNHIRAILTG